MEKSNRIKKYLIVTIIQVAIISFYTIGIFFAFKLEAVTLHPIRYILPIAILLIIIDIVSLLLIFLINKKTVEEG